MATMTPGGSGGSAPFGGSAPQQFQMPALSGSQAYNPSMQVQPGQRSQFNWGGGGQRPTLAGQPQQGGMIYNPYTSGWQQGQQQPAAQIQANNNTYGGSGSNWNNVVDYSGNAYNPQNPSPIMTTNSPYGMVGSGLMQANNPTTIAALSPQSAASQQQQLADLQYAGTHPTAMQSQFNNLHRAPTSHMIQSPIAHALGAYGF